MLDRLLALDDQPLFPEIDLGWAWYAGVEPERLLAGAAPRVPLVHVKDLATGTGPRFVPVGEGDVGYGRILPAIRGLGVEWLLVEQDETTATGWTRSAAPSPRSPRWSGRPHEISGTVGIIGCGVISRAYIVNAAAFDTFEIVACADLDASRAEATAAEFALEPVTVEELLRSDSIDVVLNLTPPAAHAPVTRAALDAGKHVYFEKPLGTTVSEARELGELAESRGLRLGCAPTSS